MQHEGYFGTDLVILNLGQMTRTTPDLVPSLQSSVPHQREDVSPPTYDLACKQAQYTTDLRWNQVWNLKPSGPKAQTLPLGTAASSNSLQFLC
ncbi:hypothetical protein AVEN_40510-1 [Araneus ventricosus]|uniref:Uncharacterized protein n=1 Tax=Araneus ventricosus TaxID=182803 RepID=A0A4Y2IPN8_ARAVE|nr:hypothetical protein AVEN_40510-1 [Araneus ventricosus]